MAEAHNQDSPWKETHDRFLQPFLELTFTKVDRSIDGSVDPISLEHEFRKTVPDAHLGPLRADKLIQVRQLNGTDEWLLIRIEVQMQCDPKLPHEFWPDDLTLTEDRLQPKLPASKHLTDHFFLVQAVKHRGAF